MTLTARICAGVVAVGLVGGLSACSADNPFGQVVRGGTLSTPPDSAIDPTSASSPLFPTDSPTGDVTATDTMSPSSTDTATTTPTDTSTVPVPSASAGSPTTMGDPASPAPTTGATATSPAAATASSSTPESGRVQVDGRTITGVPTGIGFPVGTTIAATNAFSDAGSSVVMSAPSESAVFSYYRSALPAAGYRVLSDTAGTLAFAGHGYRGTLVGTGEGGVLTWAQAQN